jgi:hypothetical protein
VSSAVSGISVRLKAAWAGMPSARCAGPFQVHATEPY